jgi:hypothetical protein
LRILNDCGHFVAREQPAAVVHAIRATLHTDSFDEPAGFESKRGPA